LQVLAQTTTLNIKISSLKRRKKGLLTKDALKSFLAMTKTFGSSFSPSFWIKMKDAHDRCFRNGLQCLSMKRISVERQDIIKVYLEYKTGFI